MRVLFYVPDNRITHSYMPTLWPYVLKSLTPPGHMVVTLDGNVVRMDPTELSEYVQREKFDLVGMGGMTRTIHRSYAVADSIRAMGVPVAMGRSDLREPFAGSGIAGPDEGFRMCVRFYRPRIRVAGEP